MNESIFWVGLGECEYYAWVGVSVLWRVWEDECEFSLWNGVCRSEFSLWNGVGGCEWEH